MDSSAFSRRMRRELRASSIRRTRRLAASTSAAVQGRDLPRTSSDQAAKDARGSSVAPGTVGTSLCGLPAQVTTCSFSARNHIRIVGTSVDMVTDSMPLATSR